MAGLERVVIGVDVGTGSARAGVFDLTGRRLGCATAPIQIWKPRPEWAEQSSDDIWAAVGSAVRQAVLVADVDPARVAGIGFDATCSLVVLDGEDRPVTVSDAGDDARNVIVWMDHRAVAEAEAINNGAHAVLRYVGGRISPEMQTPKLRWLKAHLPESWARAARFLDLADYLTYMSTGRDVRSICTTTCKWTYLGSSGKESWDREYFADIGLEDAIPRIGASVRPLGEAVGPVTPVAARHLGLPETVRVAVGIIDAHAGGIGSLGSLGAHSESFESAMALIGGTSSCHMSVSREPRFMPGVWGPYYGAMLPGLWLNEGGQSATGALIDYTLDNHAQGPALAAEAATRGLTIYEVINEDVNRLATTAGLAHPALLTRNIHVLDYHLGNRSPIADPNARGILDGLSLDTSRDSLALLYLATIQAVAYGTRHIIETFNENGYAIRDLYVTGGGVKNPVWLQEHADITTATIHLSAEPDAVLLGSAILGAVAAGAHPTVQDGTQAMCHSAAVVRPNPATAAFHAAKYRCYRDLYAQQTARRAVMAATTEATQAGAA